MSEIWSSQYAINLSSWKKQPEKKNSGLHGIRTHDLAILVQAMPHG